MDSALIVSSTSNSITFFTEMLHAASLSDISVIPSCGEARRQLFERDFDLVIVNAPLKDEVGESLARQISAKGQAQVILVVKAECFDQVAAICEDDGVLTVAKPIHRTVFWSALSLAKSAQSRVLKMKAENQRLKQKIEDILIVDRAKCLLISHLRMSEQDAHRYIEKQAMDIRSTRRAVAEGILKTYDV